VAIVLALFSPIVDMNIFVFEFLLLAERFSYLQDYPSFPFLPSQFL